MASYDLVSIVAATVYLVSFIWFGFVVIPHVRDGVIGASRWIVLRACVTASLKWMSVSGVLFGISNALSELGQNVSPGPAMVARQVSLGWAAIVITSALVAFMSMRYGRPRAEDWPRWRFGKRRNHV